MGRRARLRGEGRRALAVGAGLGFDAEHLAALGSATTAFDVAPTAVAMARERFPGSRLDYCVADLLDLPREWEGAFDLVVEIITGAVAARGAARARDGGDRRHGRPRRHAVRDLGDPRRRARARAAVAAHRASRSRPSRRATWSCYASTASRSRTCPARAAGAPS